MTYLYSIYWIREATANSVDQDQTGPLTSDDSPFTHRPTVQLALLNPRIYLTGDKWTDARRPAPRLWIRSAEVRGERR